MKQVKICLGRFQPFTLGHLKLATYKTLNGPEAGVAKTLREQPDLKEIAKQKTVILVVSTPKEKIDNRHPFEDELMKKEFNEIKKAYSNDIEDILYVKSADICAWGEQIKQNGYQASVWLTGSDEYEFYNGMASKVPEYEIKNRDNRDCKDAYTKSFYVEKIQRNETSTDFVSTISGTKVRNAIKNNDKELFKKMMPKGADKYFDEFREALLNAPEPAPKKRKTKTLKEYFNDYSNINISQYIKESLNINSINEGGNAVDASPIPAFLAPKIYEQVEKVVTAKNKNVKMAPVGSLGKKMDEDTTGDIDIAIQLGSFDELIELVNNCFEEYETMPIKMSNIVSVSYPYNIDGYNDKAQIDFMLVKNLDWAKFRYHSPNFKLKESKYKGGVRNIFLSDIVSCIPVKDAKDEYFEDNVTVKRHWKYTFNTEGVFLQLVDFCGKNGKPVKAGKKLKEFEQLIANDPENVVKFIFGDAGEISDANSAESLWKAIHDPKKFKWGKDVVETIEKKIITDKGLSNFNFSPKDFPCEYYNIEK